MSDTDAIDRALEFLDKLERLGEQLKKAEKQEKIFLATMLEMKDENKTDTKEYAGLQQQSIDLQNMIDKWRPIYHERLEMVKEVKKAKENCHKSQ